MKKAIVFQILVILLYFPGGNSAELCRKSFREKILNSGSLESLEGPEFSIVEMQEKHPGIKQLATRILLESRKDFSELATIFYIPLGNHNFRFDINIKEGLRRTGFASFALKHVLERFPEVVSLPFFPNDQNLVVFINKGFPDYYKFSEFEQSFLTNATRAKAFRNRSTMGLLATPGYKIRNKLGFSRLSKLLVEPETLRVNALIEKAEPVDMDELQFIVKFDNRYFSVNPRGKLEEISKKDSVISKEWERSYIQTGQAEGSIGYEFEDLIRF